MGGLARAVLGEPNEALSTKSQLRYGTKGSLAIEIEGSKVGYWYDHENGVGGDALELIRHRKGLANGAAVDWARNWLGWSQNNSNSDAPAGESAGANSSPEEPESDDAADRAKKVADILASCEGAAGTPVEVYLRNRGISSVPPDCIRFRRKAHGQYGAMVALATDAEGRVLAVQQVYLTEEGAKAPLAVRKRTNKAVDGWADNSAVR